ncbi:MAG: acetate kinase [Thermoanaerobaculia bacterium]|jgi:acetate kinase|nr:acetate kinase [Thermoanaerobaculia bacterium]
MAVQTSVNILAINPGSSSLKFGLYEFSEPLRKRCHPETAEGHEVPEDVEGPPEYLQDGSSHGHPLRSATEAGGPSTVLSPSGASAAQDDRRASAAQDESRPLLSGNLPVAADKMEDAVREVLARANSRDIHAVGCRVVHGGAEFSAPTIVDDNVLAKISALAELAPLHNPIAVSAINAVRHALPSIPIVAVFDTAFHRSLPPVAWHYAIPDDLNIRRYGFHGISYAWVSRRLTAHIGPGKRAVIAHLGNGASVCALHDGVSIDTSMGLTPAEGLVMGTRSGDLDPGAILYLLRNGKSSAEIDDLLNHRSGLAALSGGTSDMKKIVEAAYPKSASSDAEAGDPRAILALDVFCYRISKYIGAYAAALGGLDALVFTAGIGEHAPLVRERICANLNFLGIDIDEALNRATRSDERPISRGPVSIFVIPTNEELQLANETYQLV